MYLEAVLAVMLEAALEDILAAAGSILRLNIPIVYRQQPPS